MDFFIKHERKWFAWSQGIDVYVYQTVPHKWISHFLPLPQRRKGFRKIRFYEKDENLYNESKSIFRRFYSWFKGCKWRLYWDYLTAEIIKIRFTQQKNELIERIRKVKKVESTHHLWPCIENSKTAIWEISGLYTKQVHQIIKIWKNGHNYK
jgi:hypothetical protein